MNIRNNDEVITFTYNCTKKMTGDDRVLKLVIKSAVLPAKVDENIVIEI